MCGSDSSKGPSTSRLWWGPKKQSSWAPMHFLSNYYFRRILVGWGWGVFLCGCVNVCKHTCRPQVKLRYLSSRTLSTLFFETGYLICQVLSKQSRLAGWPWGSFLSASLAAGLQACATIPGLAFFMWALGIT